MEPRIRSLQMRDGASLNFRHYPAAGTREPKGAVVAIHGIQSHGGWYGASCALLSEAGYDVAFVDRRGSGLNKAQRGDMTCYRALIDDLEEFISDARGRVLGHRVHLLAISWGAKLACAALIERPGLADSLTLIGPGLVSRVDVSVGVRLRTALALVTNPTKRFDIPLADPALFTEDIERIEFIRSDPLSLRTCTARFLYQTRKLDRLVRRRAEEMRAPTLMLLAGRDRIVDNAAVRALLARFGGRPKDAITYEGASHTLEFEPDASRIFGDIAEWLDARGAE